MFKRIAAISLLLSFSVQCFSDPSLMLDYYMNTAAYAKNCINKARPRLHCNGKCQAMKKMREEEKKEQQNAEQRGPGKTGVLSSRSFYHLLTVPPRNSEEIFCNETLSIPSSLMFSVFHPPRS